MKTLFPGGMACLVLAALCGCEKPMTDGEQDAAICDPAFLRDKQWAVLPSTSPMVQTLQRQFSNVANDAHPTRWYVNAKSNEYGSCTRSVCPDGRCLWNVAIFRERNGALKASMEYTLAPKKVR